MDLLKAVQTQSFEQIKELVTSKGIPVNTTWVDYAALNCSIERGRKDVALFLLERNCRVNKISRSLTKPSSTPLHHAVKLGDLDLMQKLLEKNASMTAVNSQGNSPLHLAFILKHEKITDLLLAFVMLTATYANPKNNHGLTHFHIACTRNNANLICSFMKIESNLNESVNEDSPYYAGYTALQFAIEFKSPIVLKLLLERCSSLSDQKHQTTLDLAKKNLQDLSVMVYILSSYIKPDSLSKMSQFHLACMQDNPALVDTFLNCGAVVNSPINEDAVFCPLYTPLHFAIESNCKENVALLLERGSDVDCQNAYYMTPLHLAMYNDNQEIVDLLYAATKNKVIERIDRNGLSYFHIAVSRNDIGVVTKFLDQNQDVNVRVFHNHRNFSGYTPLHFAVRYGHLAVAKLLVERGANVNASDMDQHGTPLHIAIAAGHRGLIEFLLSVNARVYALRPRDNKTMLHLLVEAYMDNNKRKNLLMYVDRFALGYQLDINAKDNDGYTALHYACSKISVGSVCALALLECGADINIENNVGDTPFELSFYDVYRNNAKDYMVLFSHVKGLKTLGLWVNPKNNECCDRLLKEKDECQKGAECFRTMNLVKKQQERINEFNRMKNCKLSKNNVSLYDFLHMGEKQLMMYVNNDVLWRLAESGIKRDFPNFGYLLRLQLNMLMKLQPRVEFSSMMR